GTSCIHFIVAPNQIDQRQVARSVLRFRVNVVHFFCWLGATHADRRLPIPKRPVPDRHSLQVLLQPVLLAEFSGLTKRRGSERQNRLTVDLQHEDGRRWRLGIRWHHHLNHSFLGWSTRSLRIRQICRRRGQAQDRLLGFTTTELATRARRFTFGGFSFSSRGQATAVSQRTRTTAGPNSPKNRSSAHH